MTSSLVKTRFCGREEWREAPGVGGLTFGVAFGVGMRSGERRFSDGEGVVTEEKMDGDDPEERWEVEPLRWSLSRTEVKPREMSSLMGSLEASRACRNESA